MEQQRLLRTKAIVLRSKDYLETSRLVTLFTEKYGKISAIAKGYRRPKSQFGNSLEIFTIVELILHNKSTREIQIITQCETDQTFQKLSENMVFYAYGSAILELFDKLIIAQDTTSKEANKPLFSLLRDFLMAIETSPEDKLKPLFLAFKLKLAHLLGYSPNLEECVICQSPVNEVNFYFDVAKGGIIHKDCNSRGQHEELVYINLGLLKTIQKLIAAKITSILRLKISEKNEKIIDMLIDKFLRYNVQGYGNLKSIKFLEDVRG
jgi:DNA repair protein RecO (recombination protein O)